MPRTLLGTIALLFLLVGNAAACIDPESQATIFLDNPLHGTTASVIAKIAVTRIISDRTQTYVSGGIKFYGFYVVGVRVEQVLRGALGQDDIQMIAPGSSCDQELRVGEIGIVAGRVETSSEGVLQLIALSETAHQYRARRALPQ